MSVVDTASTYLGDGLRRHDAVLMQLFQFNLDRTENFLGGKEDFAACKRGAGVSKMQRSRRAIVASNNRAKGTVRDRPRHSEQHLVLLRAPTLAGVPFPSSQMRPMISMRSYPPLMP
jgi:hypothetical protein